MGQQLRRPQRERRRRPLRQRRSAAPLVAQAEGIPTGQEFAEYLGWTQSGISQFESGERRVPMTKALQLRAKIPGFDPVWLREGDKRGLSLDLRKRIEAVGKHDTAEFIRLMSSRRRSR